MSWSVSLLCLGLCLCYVLVCVSAVSRSVSLLCLGLCLCSLYVCVSPMSRSVSLYAVCRCWNTATLQVVTPHHTFVVPPRHHVVCCVFQVLSLKLLIARLRVGRLRNPSWHRLRMRSCFLGWASSVRWRHLYTGSAQQSLTSHRPCCQLCLQGLHQAQASLTL